MEFKEIDFYLESISESYRNTKLVKKGIHSNLVYHIRQNSSQKYYEYRTDKIGKSRSKNTIEEYDKLDPFQKQSQLISHLGKLSKIRKEYFEKDYDQLTDSDNTSDSDSE